MKEAALSKAITEFRNQIEKSDYANLGAKGKYLTVPYRLKFIREHFGERISIQSESYDIERMLLFTVGNLNWDFYLFFISSYLYHSHPMPQIYLQSDYHI